MIKSKIIRFVTGTVGSGKKPLQYIQAPDHVGVALVTTTKTLEHCPIAVPPIGMTAAWAPLTAVKENAIWPLLWKDEM